MKKIEYSRHALEQMVERGANRTEVEAAIRRGERVPAKKDRHAYRINLEYHGIWCGKKYAMKQVMPVVVEEGETFVVITVYVFFF